MAEVHQIDDHRTLTSDNGYYVELNRGFYPAHYVYRGHSETAIVRGIGPRLGR